MGRKRVNLRNKEDRISDLPDEIIQHILSFLPSTKQAIRTSILSKRWRKQWTHVPVLIFNYSTCMSSLQFLKIIHDTLLLHECSKIEKFHLKYSYFHWYDPHFNAINLMQYVPQQKKVNWGSLTVLSMACCKLNDQAIEHILCGTPLLESFELIECYEFDKLVIASKSMKRLVLQSPNQRSPNCRISVIQISCPKLEKFKIDGYLNATTFELLNSSSSLCATIDFLNNYDLNTSKEIIGSLIKDILHQLRHVNELTIGRFVVQVPRGHAENDWSSNLNVLVPHLKTIKIVGFPVNSDDKYTYSRKMLSFIQFLLNNAKALEKMVIELEGHDEFAAFQSRLSKKLSCLTRSSQHAIIEVLCSNKYRG